METVPVGDGFKLMLAAKCAGGNEGSFADVRYMGERPLPTFLSPCGGVVAFAL